MSIEQRLSGRCNKPSSRPKAPAKPCALCGTLARTGRDVPPVGWVGPECSRKVQLLEAVLQQNGLTEIFTAELHFAPEREIDERGQAWWVMPDAVTALSQKAEALGLVFDWTWERFGELASARVSLPKKPGRSFCRQLERRLRA